jgi:hypothetical protein
VGRNLAHADRNAAENPGTQRSRARLPRSAVSVAAAVGLLLGVLSITAATPSVAGADSPALTAPPTPTVAPLTDLAKLNSVPAFTRSQSPGAHAAGPTPRTSAPLGAAPVVAHFAAAVFAVNTTVDAHLSGTAAPGTCVAASPPAPADSCSLRAAIEAANTSGTAVEIDLPAGSYPLSLGQLVITDPGGINIVGAGALSTEINGSTQSDRVLQLSGGSAVAQLSGLDIEHGSAPTGPGAVDPGYGGGISVFDPTDSLVLNSVIVEQNTATAGGAGIDNFGQLWATGSTITANQLTDTGRAFTAGGGLANEFFGSVELTNDTISNNAISGTGTGTSNTVVSGAGIDTYGTMSMHGGSISANTISLPSSTDPANPSEGDGGGLTVDGPTTLTDVTVDHNQILPVDSATNVTSFGAGIADIAGLTNVFGSSIEDNTAIADLHASGGGLSIRSGLVNIETSDVSGNSAEEIGGTVANGSSATGGGISTLIAGSVNVSGSTIDENAASATTPDVKFTVSAAGGGIFLLAGTSTIANSSINENHAGSEGSPNSAGFGGGIAALNPVVGGLDLSHDQVNNNSAFGGYGGGVVSFNTGSTTIFSSSINGNKATNGDLAVGGTQGDGGGIFGFGTSSVRDTTVDSNHADTEGGGFVETAGGVISSDTISNNTAGVGAGLYVSPFIGNSPPTQVKNSTIAGNVASGEAGGGIAVTSTSVSLTYSTVTGNTGPIGGGVVAIGGTYLATGSIISGNTAPSSPDCAVASGPTPSFTSSGYNLIGAGCATSPAPTDLVGVDAMLAGLADNGGPTHTAALLRNSPAIDAGGGPSCPLTDQRGVTRPQGKACDIGAFESTYSGYWEVASDGGIFAFGDAGFFGSMGGQPLNKPVVGMASTSDGQGYWEVASDGGIFTFGDAVFHGSMGGQPLSKRIVGMAATPDGQGYWLVGADGAVYNFGDADLFGSASGHKLIKPVVGMAGAPDGKGYWLTAANGAVFAYGSAKSYGDPSDQALNAPVTSIARTPAGKGYTLAATDGGIFAFGDAGFFGSMGGQPLNKPVMGLAATNDGQGYWLFATDGGVFSFGDAVFHGSMGGQPLNAPMVGGATPT